MGMMTETSDFIYQNQSSDLKTAIGTPGRPVKARCWQVGCKRLIDVLAACRRGNRVFLSIGQTQYDY